MNESEIYFEQLRSSGCLGSRPSCHVDHCRRIAAGKTRRRFYFFVGEGLPCPNSCKIDKSRSFLLSTDEARLST